MRRIFLAVTAVFAFSLLAAAASFADGGAQEWEASVLEVGGSVEIMPSGSQEWEPAPEQTPLQAGDRLKTGKGSFARVSLDGEGMLELDELSLLTVASVQYSSASFSVAHGSLLGKIKDLFSRKRRFEVRTPAAVCAVRGTEFAVAYSSATRDTVAGVFDDGEILVGGLQAQESEYVPVSSGREVVLARAGGGMRSQEMKLLKIRKARMAQVSLRVSALRGSWKRTDASERVLLRRKLLKQRNTAVGAKRQAAGHNKQQLQQKQRQQVQQRAAARQAALEDRQKRLGAKRKARRAQAAAGQ